MIRGPLWRRIFDAGRGVMVRPGARSARVGNPPKVEAAGSWAVTAGILRVRCHDLQTFARQARTGSNGPIPAFVHPATNFRSGTHLSALMMESFAVMADVRPSRSCLEASFR